MKSIVYVPMKLDKSIEDDDVQGKLIVYFMRQGWDYGGRIILKDSFGT